MPRGFSDQEMHDLRKKLIDTASEALNKTGIRKTTVEELARGANLSIGAFYKFYPSKEALFFEIYEINEEELKNEFLKMLSSAGEVNSPIIGQILKQLLRSEAMLSLLQLMRKDELDYMLRNIDPTLVSEHMQKDQDFILKVFQQLRARNIEVKMDAEMLISYLQALFVLCFERDQYPQYSSQIIDAFVDTILVQAIG